MLDTKSITAIKKVIINELKNYNDYCAELGILDDNEKQFAPISKGKDTRYITRIFHFVGAVDRAIRHMTADEKKLLDIVLTHQTESIKRFATTHFIDLCTAYRWRRHILELIMIEMGYQLPQQGGFLKW